MNGFVVADPSRCIGCFACQAACVENHRRVGLQAYPRLIVSYTPQGTMPMQCRQCEDAPCRVVCPVKAIVHQDGSIRLNEALCIGCKMCGLACPFGVIVAGGTPVPFYGFNIGQYSYVTTPYQAEPMHLREMSRHDVLSLVTWHLGQKKVAIKCDLCYFDDQGPACVRACPHKALSRIEETNGEGDHRIERIKAVARVRQDALPTERPAGQGDD